MSQYILKDGSVATISHRMADGTIRDSIEDVQIPINEQTKIIYDILARQINAREGEQ